jgi:TRAP-type C4-dicarboxylate transport system permease small subunit
MNAATQGQAAWRAERFGRGIETALLALTLGAMIGLATLQIALRNFWGAGLPWADEALRILVLWVTMAGAVAASREQRHVSIDALSRYLPPGARRAGGALVGAFTAVVCFVVAWYSYRFVADSWSADDRVLGGSLPAWTVQLVLPTAFALIGYRYVVAALRQLAGPPSDTERP